MSFYLFKRYEMSCGFIYLESELATLDDDSFGSQV